MRDRQVHRFAALSSNGGAGLCHRVGVTGDDHRAWPVDGCDRAPGLVGDQCLGLLHAEVDCDHRPAGGQRDPINRPLTATSLAASSSDSTPARQAAAISPTLWPMPKAGRIPLCSNVFPSA